MPYPPPSIELVPGRQLKNAGYQIIRSLQSSSKGAQPAALTLLRNQLLRSGYFESVRMTRELAQIRVWVRLSAVGEQSQARWSRRRLFDWLRAMRQDIDDVLLLSPADIKRLGLEASLHNVRCLLDSCLGQNPQNSSPHLRR